MRKTRKRRQCETTTSSSFFSAFAMLSSHPIVRNRTKKENFFTVNWGFDLPRRSFVRLNDVRKQHQKNKTILFDFEFSAHFSRIFSGVSHFILFWHVIKSEIMNIAPNHPSGVLLLHFFLHRCCFIFLSDGIRFPTFMNSWYSPEEARRQSRFSIQLICRNDMNTRCRLDAHHKLITFRVGGIRAAVRDESAQEKVFPL